MKSKNLTKIIKVLKNNKFKYVELDTLVPVDFINQKSSEEIKTREDWKSNKSAQTTVKLENLLDEIKKIVKNN